ncbi:hypothetical protein [Shewanella sp. Isolate7]|nr:hypothetical protein [Shewanella sp. Isolate7]
MNALIKAWNATPELIKPIVVLSLLGLLGIGAFFCGQLIGLLIY